MKTMSTRQTQSKNVVPLGLPSRLLFSLTTLLITPAIAPEASLAFSFAGATATFNFNNFSHQADSTLTSTVTDSFTFANLGSSSDALSQADAIFFNPPDSESFASNLTVSIASGEGKEFQAIAEAEAKVVGNFLLEESQTFSFDFFGHLQLDTYIERPTYETATAAGDVLFLLFDSTNPENPQLLDSFNVAANLASPGDSDFLTSNQSSSNLSLYFWNEQTAFGGLQELSFAEFAGNFQRDFDESTHLTLVEVKATLVTAKAPEPSATIGLGLLGLGALGLKARKNRQEQSRKH